MKLKKIIVLLIIILTFPTNAFSQIQIENEIYALIQKYHFYNKNISIICDRLIGKGTITNLDKYSEYYSPNEVEDTKIKDHYFSKEVFNFGYVRFTNFLDETDNKFVNTLTEFNRKNVRTFILDLSFCDGGDLNSAINIAKQLVPKGKICEIEFKNETKTYYSELAKCPFENIIILTSSQTASASEILISALKESNCAFIIGTNTYGKTAIQRNFALSNGGVLKLTVGKYYTRKGNDIEGVGVEPDINILHCLIALICIVFVFVFLRIFYKRYSSRLNVN